ncbi:MAG: hypothetical protein JOZ62_18660 [Acidobacteriaceae bacterium]|nr:hypothetical protein [Acidobacteriaceae bacterium]
MSTNRIRRQQLRIRVGNPRELDRSARFRVYAARPSDAAHEGCGRNELTGFAIEYIEEAVFVCLQEDLSRRRQYAVLL